VDLISVRFEARAGKNGFKLKRTGRRENRTNRRGQAGKKIREKGGLKPGKVKREREVNEHMAGEGRLKNPKGGSVQLHSMKVWRG